MRRKFQFLKVLAAVCLIAGGVVAPLAQAGTIVVGAPVGATVDTVARHLVRYLGTTYIVLNKSGFDAASAAREMRGKAIDGSELMMVQVHEELAAGGKSPAASEFAHLQPIAMLGEIQVPNGKIWFGLFAPPGTPAWVVNSLNEQVRGAMITAPPSKIASSVVQYAQDMSANALLERVRAPTRAQAAKPSTPAPAASSIPARSADDPKGVGGGASPD
jgi:tripartite-type tricarboxylate transporter receptor subunit TctC